MNLVLRNNNFSFMNLYHASTTQNITTLEPRKRYTPSGKIDFEAIYATKLPAFAVAHSFSWDSSEGILLQVDEKTFQVTLKIPKDFEERLNVPISLYTISSETFQQTQEESTGLTFYSREKVKVISQEKFESVTKALEKYNGKVVLV
jgi:hypothetical protein